MCLVDVPLGQGIGLVLVHAQRSGPRHFAHGGAEAERVRRGVDGIAAQQHQRLHLPTIHRGAQVAEVCVLLGRNLRDRLGIGHSRTDRSKLLVQRDGSAVRRDRGLRTGNHDGLATGLLQVV